MSATDLDYWVANRAAILDAIEKQGFKLMSNKDGFWLVAARPKTSDEAFRKKKLTMQMVAPVSLGYAEGWKAGYDAGKADSQ